MSKSLTTDEIIWSTIEKECYAIVVALHKFEYLLRDRKFTLRTDHDNLTYMNDPPSPLRLDDGKYQFKDSILILNILKEN